MLSRICVFAGSSPGLRPEYRAGAAALGSELVSRRLALVYGGAKVGLMGTVADAVLQCGGTVIGIIPDALVAKEVAHPGLTELHVVGSMHERKQQMAMLADAFVALPGGLGTAEELLEIVTWAQLGLHAKPCGLLNIAGYFDRLIAFLDHAVAERFLTPQHRHMLIVGGSPAELLDAFATYTPPAVEKWIDRENT